MKLSVRWMFDHIRADLKKVGIDAIVKKISSSTAEIDGIESVNLDLSDYTLATVVGVDDRGVTVESTEWKKTFTLSAREGALIGRVYFIKKQGDKVFWSQCTDWGAQKDGLVAAVFADKKVCAGGWKKLVETEDWILDIDNKSITNRPDLWGHRGFAREVSALLGLTFIPEKELHASLAVKAESSTFKPTKKIPYTFKNSAPQACNRLAALYIDSIENRPSSIGMATRLLRVNSKPIDLLVDATNYVMLDGGHPMHAFDPSTFGPKLEACMATAGQELQLLDGTSIKLTHDDLIITDGTKPLALAGVMGGKGSGVSAATKSLIIEAAHFDATTVRVTATRHKQRTEASARFEKTLDPLANISALKRYVKILEDENVKFTTSETIVSLGKEPKPAIIQLSHEFIEQRLGITLTPAFIKKSLTSIGMSVAAVGKKYKVTVPTFRSSKDITIAEDIVEELLRLYGFDNIPLTLPRLQPGLAPRKAVFTVRKLKQYLAFNAGMSEVENYMLYDNDFLKLISWDVVNGVTLANSLSEQRGVLVTSLVPHLLQNVHSSAADHDALRFFEWARDWSMESNSVKETRRLAGIFFHKKTVDFYEVKEHITGLFESLSIPVEFKKSEKSLLWAHKYQCASVEYAGTHLGHVAKVSQKIMSLLGGGDACVFEIDGDALLNSELPDKIFKAVPKFQSTWLDISMMVPLSVSVDTLSKSIQASDARVFEVQLVDIFKKDEWNNQKSVTMRFGLRDANKTLSKEDIDAAYSAAQKSVALQGAVIR